MQPGQLTEITWKQNIYRNPATGIEEQGHSIELWADPGKTEIIKSVPGVTNVYTNLCDTSYSVFIDRRFDVQFVGKEIEAAILCAQEICPDCMATPLTPNGICTVCQSKVAA